ncbi:Hsp20/alpha crystallin family protein [Phycicoccus sp. SLBN-51]|jgi:HSP20 family protein|uniref:Hsp20/alpha crystallin family protein n=1 Tax=Phycicoccus sp. SLBN-51 TaxID=2768447 RepID=UPI0011749D74|nr:Hsp20/alpha crystallin family protein [Phycicoccus sp. SLBN-51]TQJ49807.1 HSP20 family protein [Phycicoccus sp. SLBN-51]
MTSNTPSRSTELRRRTPWEEFSLAPWSHRMRELMEDVFQGLPAGVDFAPGGELQETDDAFTVELDLPGVDKKDINIEMSDRRLTVRGERVVKEKEGVMRHSTRVTGTFSYEAILPCPIDEAKVSAALSEGVLTITMPKASEAKSTHITVK